MQISHVPISTGINTQLPASRRQQSLTPVAPMDPMVMKRSQLYGMSNSPYSQQQGAPYPGQPYSSPSPHRYPMGIVQQKWAEMLTLRNSNIVKAVKQKLRPDDPELCTACRSRRLQWNGSGPAGLGRPISGLQPMSSQYGQQQQQNLSFSQPGQPPYFSPSQQPPAAPSQPPYLQPCPLPSQEVPQEAYGGRGKSAAMTPGKSNQEDLSQQERPSSLPTLTVRQIEQLSGRAAALAARLSCSSLSSSIMTPSVSPGR
ncbi:hypothetical protein CCH79_00018489 [Gambusia affinis]|uniref:Uncharacterized protein n=1 Tax=Gambusia affinis TaxID=33528 RepID=A0A315UQU0_GAMAF|nr:hypothetical protein CCH79_00018489 [Gambusia affinis]